MTLPDRKYSSGKGYRFGFQGQETDDEVNGDGNSIYFKYRVHDPRIGRFASIDPLAPKYPWNSPYAFSENQVINAVELEGLEKQVVTYGIKNKYDDNYVKSCGAACAQAMGLAPQGISTGDNLLSILKSETKTESLSVYINYGHSWNVGLYLTNNKGFYNGTLNAGGPGSANLSDFKSLTSSGDIKISTHSLYIFASCGTCGDASGAVGNYSQSSFAASFGDYVDMSATLPDQNISKTYKVTTIGATGLSNLKQDGTVVTDGKFIKTEKVYEITKKAVYKTVSPEWWEIWKKKKKVFSHWDVSTKEVQSKTTDLGKKIDPAKIAKSHDDQDTTIN